ncbi:hypothetical protein RDI58_017439 [Solanum bulbocastanum]|uniref:Uncharacterized protein n=1 Tax=Solanum bulbocastanum TaxID=147425 RepID=A0AAN8Y8V1_SOLBU
MRKNKVNLLILKRKYRFISVMLPQIRHPRIMLTICGYRIIFRALRMVIRRSREKLKSIYKEDLRGLLRCLRLNVDLT